MAGKIFNIPNIFSISRVLLLPIMFFLVINNHPPIIIIITIGIIMLTDYLDGYYARRLNLVSNTGKILDPIADKITIIGLATIAVLYRSFPLWALIVIIIRELLIATGVLVVYKRKKHIAISNFFGKAMMFFLGLSILAYLIMNAEESVIPLVLLYIGLFFMVFSFFSYLYKYSMGNNRLFLKFFCLPVSFLLFTMNLNARKEELRTQELTTQGLRTQDYSYFLQSRIAILDRSLGNVSEIKELVLRIRWQKISKEKMVKIPNTDITIPWSEPYVESDYPMKVEGFNRNKIKSVKSKSIRKISRKFRETDFIICKSKNIRKLVKGIVRREDNSFKIAILIADWIRKNIRYRANMVLHRIGKILQKRETGFAGYSLLFTTMLRSKEIPSNIVLGIKYANNSFILHAWVKVFVGEWIQLDPATGDLLINPTYISFFEGDEKVFDNAISIDSIKVKSIKIQPRIDTNEHK